MLFQVEVKILKDQVKLLVTVHNVLKPATTSALSESAEKGLGRASATVPDDVVVIQLFQQRYFPDSGARHALFFLLEPNLLQGNCHSCVAISCAIHDAICSFTNFLYLLVLHMQPKLVSIQIAPSRTVRSSL